uniref:MEG-30 protein n=1 Tax=Schistosoma mansoni TaxID=6183 RepID=A0A0U5KI45_SCHMA|nr:TPA: MEG-30 protein [Schistosoma mansoni]
MQVDKFIIYTIVIIAIAIFVSMPEIHAFGIKFFTTTPVPNKGLLDKLLDGLYQFFNRH